MVTLTTPIFWLKEMSKSWVYIVSDEVVYREQVSKPNSRGIIGLARNKGGYVKAYLSDNLWLEIVLSIRRNEHSQFYVALVETCESVKEGIFRVGQSSGNRNSRHARQNQAMLINIVNGLQNPKRMPSLLPLRSFIRLHRLDISPDIITETIKATDEVLIPVEEDGEIRGSVSFDSKRPRDIVKRRTQTMSQLTNQQTPHRGELSGEIGIDDIAVLLNVLIDGSSVRLTCDEGIDFRVEDIKVFLRPVDTSEGASHLLHDVTFLSRPYWRRHAACYLGGSVDTNSSPRSTHSLSCLSESKPAESTKTNPFMGLPVKSIGRA